MDPIRDEDRLFVLKRTTHYPLPFHRDQRKPYKKPRWQIKLHQCQTWDNSNVPFTVGGKNTGFYLSCFIEIMDPVSPLKISLLKPPADIIVIKIEDTRSNVRVKGPVTRISILPYFLSEEFIKAPAVYEEI